jgi:ABC-type branched-subunit amino acid transport system permease subunit
VLTASAALTIGAITMRLSGYYLPLGTIAWSISLYYLFRPPRPSASGLGGGQPLHDKIDEVARAPAETVLAGR